jgi:hypothetical protein
LKTRKSKHTLSFPKKSPKTPSRQKTTSKTIKVHGHWRVTGTGITYYVRPYKYTRKVLTETERKKKPVVITDYPGRKLPPVPPGYRFVKRYVISEPEGRVVYTYKIEILIEYSGRYLTTFSMDKDLRNQVAIEYYHTHFEPTIERATVDFHELIPLLNAYGHIRTYLAIDLYRVAGEGELKEKHWKLIRSYDKPEEVK